MKASLKPTLAFQRDLSLKSQKNPLQGMIHIKNKITALQHQYDHLLRQRHHAIAQLITTLDLASLEDQILVGALLFLKEKITIQDPIVEDWQQAGGRFLRKFHPKKQPPSREAQTSSPKAQSTQKQS